MDTSDKYDDETWAEYWARKHDERHGPLCNCTANPGRISRNRGLLPASMQTEDTVPEGKRIERDGG